MPIPTEPGTTLEPITRGPIQRPQIARFAAATGDFNPIHTDEAFAQKIGFPSIIAHGPLTLAFLAQALGHNFGPERVRAVAAQFRAPILPGDTLRVEVHDEGPPIPRLQLPRHFPGAPEPDRALH